MVLASLISFLSFKSHKALYWLLKHQLTLVDVVLNLEINLINFVFLFSCHKNASLFKQLHQLFVIKTKRYSSNFDSTVLFRIQTSWQGRHLFFNRLLHKLVKWSFLHIVCFVHLISKPEHWWNVNFNTIVSNSASFNVPYFEVNFGPHFEVVKS